MYPPFTEDDFLCKKLQPENMHTLPNRDEFVSRIDFFDCFNYIVYIRLYKEN
jgi:hypothetical protein